MANVIIKLNHIEYNPGVILVLKWISTIWCICAFVGMAGFVWPGSSPANCQASSTAIDGTSDFENGSFTNTSVFDDYLQLKPVDYQLNDWERMIPPDQYTPPGRSSFGMFYYDVTGEIYIFGGFQAGNIRLNDLWKYNHTSNLWTNIPQQNPPTPRASFCMAYDSINHAAVLFGGLDINGGPLEETWIYFPANNTWERRYPSNVTAGGSCSAFIFVEQIGEFVYYNGETWTYNMTTNEWIQKHPDISPKKRLHSYIEYDHPSGKIILYGGYGADAYFHDFQNDTWTYDIMADTWTDITPPEHPDIKDSYTMAYDPVLEEIVIFGGRTGWGFSNKTWSYNSTTNSWKYWKIYDSPPETGGGRMIYDASEHNFKTFGGYLGSDLWELRYNSLFVVPEGQFESRMIDTGGQAYFGSIEWSSPSVSDTFIGFQIRSANTTGNLSRNSYMGPDATTKYYNISGQQINGIHNNSRLLQYRIFMNTSISNHIPRIDQVRINYNLIHTLSITSPVGGENWTDIRQIAWSASDKDNDRMTFAISIISHGNETLLVSNVPNGTYTWDWNTSLYPNGTYIVKITAWANESPIPLSVTVFTSEITIYHKEIKPPPIINRSEPECSITSPLNGSKVSKKISIRGTSTMGNASIVRVEISIDHGDWKSAIGIENWSFEIDTLKMNPSNHIIEARSFDGNIYSNVSGINITVNNPKPISSKGFIPSFELINILVTITIALFFILRRRY